MFGLWKLKFKNSINYLYVMQHYISILYIEIFFSSQLKINIHNRNHNNSLLDNVYLTYVELEKN